MSSPAPQPLPDAPQPEEVPWWLKYAGRGMGTFGGIVAMALGLWTCISFSPICIVAGIWQIMAGFVVVLAEAPCCCMFLDFVQTFTNFIDRRPVWHKAGFYILISLPAMFLCAGLSTFLGSAMLFATGVVYGLMALGKKASRGEMLNRAQTDFLATNLVKNMEVPIPNQSVP
uniref:Calcium channel flower n=1 Tax=Daphnia galeata TaxID=27404 RepID=A0A8J2S0Z7_9CRUS|nr:unnamed protein product [Daphnia galeata]